MGCDSWDRMRGYHPTAIPDQDTHQETLARHPLALIDARGADDAIIIGHDNWADDAIMIIGHDLEP
jgi:hypothetical protein